MATRKVLTGTTVAGDSSTKNVGTSAGTVAAGDDSRITGAIQSSVVTTRGDLIRRGASAPERFAAVTAGNVVAGDGTDVVSEAIATTLGVAPSANRTALQIDGAYATDNLTAQGSWSKTNGLGTITFSGSGALFHSDSATNTGGANAPRLDQTFAHFLSRGTDASVKISSFTSSGQASDCFRFALYNSGSETTGVVFEVYGDGSGAIKEVSGGAYTTQASIGAGTFSYAAALWLRITADPLGFIVWSGTGSTFASATWTKRYYSPGSSSPNNGWRVPFEPLQRITALHYKGNSAAGADDVTVTALNMRAF